MLNELEMEPLEACQAKIKLRMFYKTHYGLIGISPPSYVHLAHERSRRNHDQTYLLLIGSTDYYKFSFYPNTIVLWNGLTQAAVGAPNLLAFKAAINHHGGSDHGCLPHSPSHTPPTTRVSFSCTNTQPFILYCF